MSNLVPRRARYLGVALLLVTSIVSAPAVASAATSAVSFRSTSDAAGTASLQYIACNSPSLCVAIGDNNAENAWYVVAIRHGVPSPPQLIAGAEFISDLTCSDAHHCVAVGDHVVAIDDGVAAAPQTTGGGSGVACPTASQCYSVGGDTVDSIVNGTVAGTSTTSEFHSLLDVSCLSSSTCVVLGFNPLPAGPNPFVNAYAVMTNGVIGAPVALHANQDSEFVNITCAGTERCYVGGSFEGNVAEAVRLNLVGGVLTQSRVIDEGTFGSPEFDAAACPRSNRCAFSGFNSIVLTNRVGQFSYFGGAGLPDDSASILSLACPSATKCFAVGNHTDPSDPDSFVGFVQPFSIT